MINKLPPSKGLNIRIPVIILFKGRGFINQGSGLNTRQHVLTCSWRVDIGFADGFSQDFAGCLSEKQRISRLHETGNLATSHLSPTVPEQVKCPVRSFQE